LPKRKVRELVKPVLFIPETKIGSELLRRNAPEGAAIGGSDRRAWDGGRNRRPWKIWWKRSSAKAETQESPPAPDVVREPDGGLVMRGSMPIGDVEELLGVKFGDKTDEAVTTLAGLLSHVSGKVPAPGDKIELADHRLRSPGSKQRKVCACGFASR